MVGQPYRGGAHATGFRFKMKPYHMAQELVIMATTKPIPLIKTAIYDPHSRMNEMTGLQKKYMHHYYPRDRLNLDESTKIEFGPINNINNLLPHAIWVSLYDAFDESNNRAIIISKKKYFWKNAQ